MGVILDTLNLLTQMAQNGPIITPPDVGPLPKTSADPGRIQAVMRLIFTVLGAVAVLMIIIGGIKYAGSQGDPQGTAKARGTIIYAVVGLIICILAVTIVSFVLGRVA